MDPVINVFSPNDVSIFFHIWDHSIVIFRTREKWMRFSNTSHVDSLDSCRRSVVDKV